MIAGWASSREAQTCASAVGMSCRRKNSLAKTFEDSICAARRVGPKIGSSRLANSSRDPERERELRPDDRQVDVELLGEVGDLDDVPGETGRQSATSAMPGLPGAQKISSTKGLRCSDQHRACSRPPPPTTRIFTSGHCSWSCASSWSSSRVLPCRLCASGSPAPLNEGADLEAVVAAVKRDQRLEDPCGEIERPKRPRSRASRRRRPEPRASKRAPGPARRASRG